MYDSRDNFLTEADLKDFRTFLVSLIQYISKQYRTIRECICLP